MDFRRAQEDAARDTRRLALLYALALVAVVGVFHLACRLAWWLLTDGADPPIGFLAINLLATAGLMLGGSLIEYDRLTSNPSLIPHRLGARELEPGAARLDLSERRLLNLVEEMALSAHLPVPRVFVLERDTSINALTTGMRREDATLMVTRGAIERLKRDELQGIVAHEVAHIASGDVVILTRTYALSTGLEMVYDAGRRAAHLSLLSFVPGLLLLVCGWLGHLASLIIAAAMSRSREWHADAEAVRLTRLPRGLGDALRKAQWLASQPEAGGGRLGEPSAALLRPAMFQVPGGAAEWFATHPPLPARVKRLLGAALPPLPCPLPTRVDPFATPVDPLASDAAQFNAARASPAQTLAALRAGGGAVAQSPAEAGVGLGLGLGLGLVAGTRQLAVPVPATDTNAGSVAGTVARPAPAPAERGDDGINVDWLARRGLPELEFERVVPVAPDMSTRLVALARAAHEPTRAAALATLLILGAGIEKSLWPSRWRAAADLQEGLAEALKAIGPERVETLRWPLMELISATLRPLARAWREDLLWLLRTQIDLDQRVTLVEWIYYLLLRVRLLSLNDAAWPGDEASTEPAAAVRWVLQLLARVSQQPGLKAERLANDIIRAAHLSRTGQGHPPFDVGGLQSSVGALRLLPHLQRPLLMRELVAFLPADAPVEARDFLRVLAVIIDTPVPTFGRDDRVESRRP